MNAVFWRAPLLLLCFFMLLFALLIGGCGGGEVEGLCAEVVCEEGEQCFDGICLADDESCGAACREDERCESGRCVSVSGGCDYHGQACTRRQYGHFLDGHLCMDWTSTTGEEAVCSADCRTQGCPDSGTCFLVTVEGGGQCTSSESCLPGQFCYQGGCAYAACRPADCDVPGGPDPRCGSGQRCEQVGGGNLCVPAGFKQPGESCVDGATAYAEQRLHEGCVSDAVCFGGICREYCDGQSCSDEADTCIAVPTAGSTPVYGCAKSCVPGSLQEGCSTNETCVPAGETGVCQPAGSVPLFAECFDGGEACEAGAICVTEESRASYGRCLPVCDLGAAAPEANGTLSRTAQQARDATCPQSEPLEGAWTLWHLAQSLGPLELYLGDEVEPVAQVEAGEMAVLGEQGPFMRRDPGRVQWALRELGQTATDVALVEGEFSVGEGSVSVVVVMPEAGRDRDLLFEVVSLPAPNEVSWVQGIADLEDVDIWVVDETSSTEIATGVGAGEMVGAPAISGVYDVRFVATGAGADGAALLVFEDVEFTGSTRFVAFSGTMNASDMHSVGPPLLLNWAVPDLASEGALAFSCRPVNGGGVGACLQRCDAGEGLQLGRCDGEQMGCGPRYYSARQRYATVCQPVGLKEEGASCNPFAENPCQEGLYCEQYGNAAAHGSNSSEPGICTALCLVGDDDVCGEGGGCRAIAAETDYPVGECRTQCVPDANYTDAACPVGLMSCKPEATLVPTGDGVTAGYSVQEEQPYCWASGTLESGTACSQGDCVPGKECLFGRSVQNDFVATLLSPYFGTAGQMPRCRPICDPFTNQGSAHQCAENETCLFNYPWNANMGHCAERVEEKEIGESCSQTGMACGEDSICVLEGGVGQCIRFCQFVGQAAGGYARSTCPSGFQCGPFVRDIGVCRASD